MNVLLSPEEKSRLGRIDALAAIGPPAITGLVALLDERSWAVRRAVISALASLGDAAVKPLFDVVSERREDETRLAAAVDALAASSSAETDKQAIALTKHGNPAVVADSVQILGRRRHAAALPTLVELMDHADDNVAVSAVEALGRIGGRAAVESLVAAVKNPKFFRAFPAIDVLGRSGDPRAVAPLAELLDSPFLALEAARALGRTGHKQAVAPLVGLLARPGDAIVRVAAAALGELVVRQAERSGETAAIIEAIRASVPDATTVRRLAQTLRDADPGEQVAACQLLGILGGEAALATLTRLLAAPAPVSQAAADALKNASSAAEHELASSLADSDSARRLLLLPLISRPASVGVVLRCLEDEDAGVRAAACDALARIGSPTAVTALFRLLGETDPRVAQAAVAAIQSLGSLETERLALEAAHSKGPPVRRAAMRIIGYFGYGSGLDVVVASMRDEDPRVRDAAVAALPYLQDPTAIDALLDAVKDPSERLRAAAARALGQCRGDVRIVGALLKSLRDLDPWVRYYACQSLGRLAVESSAAAVGRLVDDPAGQVRVAAIEALSHLRSEVAFEALRVAAAAADPDVQRAALVGLGISRRAEAEPILFAAVRSNDTATRLVAVSAIADFDAPQAVEMLARAAIDVDAGVRTAAIGFLGARSGGDATKALINLLDRVEDQEKVLTALTTPVEGRVPVLAASLAVADDERAAQLVAALTRMHRSDADQALLTALQRAGTAGRKAAAQGVAAKKSAMAATALRRTAHDDPDPEVRRVATLLLSE